MEEAVAVAQDGSLAWNTDLCPLSGYDAVGNMLALEPDPLAEFVAREMGLSECRDDLKQTVIRDYYIGVAWCARENKFSPQTTSALISLSAKLLRNCQDNMTLEQNAIFFRELMQSHSENASSSCGEGKQWDFPPTSVPEVVAFATTGIFQHYRMFQLMFHSERPAEHSNITLSVTVPSSLPPLEEAVPQSEWDDHFKPKEVPPVTEANEAKETKDDGSDEFRTMLDETEVQQIFDFVRKKALADVPVGVQARFPETATDLGLNILPAQTSKDD